MKNQNTDIRIFEEKKIRRVWDETEETWYFSIIDIIEAITDSKRSRKYWSDLKKRVIKEGDSELSAKIGQLKLMSNDGKFYETDVANLQTIFRLIQSIPSPRAEPFKQWLAKVGQERIEEIKDPEKAIVRAKKIYEQKGYSVDWIAKRMRGINVRNTLTDEWKGRGAREGLEFAILTNEIYKGTFEKTAKQIKDFKNLKVDDNPRDHMGELEIILTMLGEATTTEITKNRNSQKFRELARDAKEGGRVAGNARKEIEQKTNKKVLDKNNFHSQSQTKKLKN